MSEAGAQLPLLEVPEQPALLSAVRQERGSYTAADEAKCSQIKELMILGRGLKVIEKRTGVSRHTLRKLRNLWTERNELAPLKQRLADRMGAILEDGLDVLHEGILDGEVSAAQLSVPLGILSDKRAQLEGEAGLVIEHRHTVDVDDFRRRLEDVRARMVSGAVTNPDPGQPVIDVQGVTDPTS